MDQRPDLFRVVIHEANQLEGDVGAGINLPRHDLARIPGAGDQHPLGLPVFVPAGFVILRGADGEARTGDHQQGEQAIDQWDGARQAAGF